MGPKSPHRTDMAAWQSRIKALIVAPDRATFLREAGVSEGMVAKIANNASITASHSTRAEGEGSNSGASRPRHRPRAARPGGKA